jgi:superfamily II DNA or RNA helicase
VSNAVYSEGMTREDLSVAAEGAVRLREHQQAAIDAVAAEFGKGVRRTAVVHPTGLGKGHLIAKLAVDEVERGGRVLVLAHREEILGQLRERVAMFDPRIPVGHIQGAQNQRNRPITTAMIQTLGRADGKRRGRLAPPTLVIVDECHRIMAKGYLETIEWAGVYKDDGARLVGLTATFVRGDRRGLADVFESVAHKVELSWAITNGPNGPCAPGADGWLTRPVGKVVVASHLDLNAAKVSRGDYQDNDLGEMVQQDAEEIVAAWQEHAGTLKTVAFLPTVDSATALTDAFIFAGVAAEMVTGKTPTAERNAIYARLHSGETQVLVNVFVLVEGWDEPTVECILWARPTKLPGVYMQGIGRGLRRHPGKAQCLILDVVGASRRQKLVTLVDLVPTAPYDMTALDDLPCEQCGAWPSKAAAVRQGDPDGAVCACGEPAERQSRTRRLQGPAEYEDLDLLLEASPFTWLQTYGGTAFLPAGEQRMVVLWLDKDTDLYIVGHMNRKGLTRDGHRLGDGLTLDEARKVAEAWALEFTAGGLNTANRSASWRRGGASEAQERFARGLGIDPTGMNKAEISDAINIAQASRMLGQRRPAGEAA